MALFSFGKKDKNPPQGLLHSVAKAPPTPPKIQTPPGTPRPPPLRRRLSPLNHVRPDCRRPAACLQGCRHDAADDDAADQHRSDSSLPARPPAHAATCLPEPFDPADRSSHRSRSKARQESENGVSRSRNAARPGEPADRNDSPLPAPGSAGGRYFSEFEASGAAATEIGLPMNMILSAASFRQGRGAALQRPDSPFSRPGYLQPTDVDRHLPADSGEPAA